MVLSDKEVKELSKRLLMSRMRILCNNGFYGLLLMHMKFGLDESCDTAYTDGLKIAFNPDFLKELSDGELDFVLMHEILHVALQHCLRGEEKDDEQFNVACDIVVNSNIYLSLGKDIKAITLRKYGESIHTVPGGKEGYEYTAEQVYSMLPQLFRGNGNNNGSNGSGSSQKGGNSQNGNGNNGQGLFGGNCGGKGNSQSGDNGNGGKKGGFWDDHSKWQKGNINPDLQDLWVKRFEDACQSITIRDPQNERGLLPLCAKRIFDELRNPQTDWRTVLNEFVQEDVTDYSFTPPDRRFEDSPFFLPDFNQKEDKVEDILFMIDTSGSMSDQMITAAYSEIKGAIDQFGGRLKGRLGFFDAEIIEPKPFENTEEFKSIRAAGGGGTDFGIIFQYVNKYMTEKPPVSIIILTDGYAPFPDEREAKGIPVLWLINNDEVNPPWGKITRIKL